MDRCDCKRKREETDQAARRAIDAFEANPTYDLFVDMCQTVYTSYCTCCDGVLHEVATKVPLLDLKRILTFLHDPKNDRMRQRLEMYPEDIVDGHMSHWKEQSDERIELLLPYTGTKFWERMQLKNLLRSPEDMSVEAFRDMINVITAK
jgi:hypothetical protein